MVGQGHPCRPAAHQTSSPQAHWNHATIEEDLTDTKAIAANIPVTAAVVVMALLAEHALDKIHYKEDVVAFMGPPNILAVVAARSCKSCVSFVLFQSPCRDALILTESPQATYGPHMPCGSALSHDLCRRHEPYM